MRNFINKCISQNWIHKLFKRPHKWLISLIIFIFFFYFSSLCLKNSELLKLTITLLWTCSGVQWQCTERSFGKNSPVLHTTQLLQGVHITRVYWIKIILCLAKKEAYFVIAIKVFPIRILGDFFSRIPRPFVFAGKNSRFWLTAEVSPQFFKNSCWKNQVTFQIISCRIPIGIPFRKAYGSNLNKYVSKYLNQ